MSEAPQGTPSPEQPKATPPAPTPEQVARIVAQSKIKTTNKVPGAHQPKAPEVTPEVKAATERPAGLPEKFKTTEDLAKAYSELEKKLGQKAPEVTPEVKAPEVAPEGEPKAADAAATEVVTKAGLNMDELTAEYASSRTLSEESYKKLETAGIPKAMVDTYIAGQEALAEKNMADLVSVAGSQDRFDSMFEWSKTNLPEADKAALNAAIDSNNHAQIKLAFKGVHAAWSKAGNNEPKGQIMGAKADSVQDVYRSMAQMLADQNTALYKTDPAERARVMAKLKRSNLK